MRATLPFLLIAAGIFPGIACGDIATANERARSGVFDETGEVRCAQEAGQLLGTCVAVVARASDSSAVIVRFPNGFSRILVFTSREFLRANATMSGVGTDTHWSLLGGIYHVRVDDQRFELSEALIFGD